MSSRDQDQGPCGSPAFEIGMGEACIREAVQLPELQAELARWQRDFRPTVEITGWGDAVADSGFFRDVRLVKDAGLLHSRLALPAFAGVRRRLRSVGNPFLVRK